MDQKPGDLTSTTVSAEFRQLTVSYGGLPDPSLMAGWEALSSGATDRYLTMLELEQGQRHRREDRVIEIEARLGFRGQILAGFVAVAILVAATIMAVFGQPWAAGLVAAIDIVTIVALFLRSARPRPKGSTAGAPSSAPTLPANASRSARRQAAKEQRSRKH